MRWQVRGAEKRKYKYSNENNVMRNVLEKPGCFDSVSELHSCLLSLLMSVRNDADARQQLRVWACDSVTSKTDHASSYILLAFLHIMLLKLSIDYFFNPNCFSISINNKYTPYFFELKRFNVKLCILLFSLNFKCLASFYYKLNFH